jgi:UrcA family protein
VRDQLFAGDYRARVGNENVQDLQWEFLQALAGALTGEITRFPVEYPTVEADFASAHGDAAQLRTKSEPVQGQFIECDAAMTSLVYRNERIRQPPHAAVTGSAIFNPPALEETVMKSPAILIVTALATVLATASSFAQADPGKQMLVHFADLDLTKPAGISAIYHRLNGAAKAVCAPLASRDVRRALQYRQCVKDALSRAVTEVNQPNLSAYYWAKAQPRNRTPPEHHCTKVAVDTLQQTQLGRPGASGHPVRLGHPLH